LNRQDQRLLGAAVARCPARGIDAAGQGRFRNDPAAPDAIDKVVLAHHELPVAQQVDQEIEHLRLDRDEVAAADQLAAARTAAPAIGGT
jgi:hypothetical protein